MSSYSPRFIRISQEVLNNHGLQPMRFPDILLTAEEKGGQMSLFEERPPLAWGAAVYKIRQDGSLYLIEQREYPND